MTTTLGALFDDPVEDKFLESVKSIIEDCYPAGWRNWTVTHPPPLDASVDRNRLKFAIPTLRLVQAFQPGKKHISERQYKNMKATLFAWPLGQALLFAPASFATALRGSSELFESFLANLQAIKPQILSCAEVNAALERESKKRPSTTTQVMASGSSASSMVQTPLIDNDDSPSYESLSPPRPSTVQLVRSQLQPIDNRLNAFERKFELLQNEMRSLVEALHVQQQQTELASADDIEMSDYEDYSQSENDADSVTAQVPNHLDYWDDVAPKKASEQKQCEAAGFEAPNFDPMTVTQEPDVPDPPDVLRDQLIACQRLGQAGWNRVRYSEVEPQLKRSGVFQPLLVNNQLMSYHSRSRDFKLRQEERLLGIISYGLLAQRHEFQQACKQLIDALPATTALVTQKFTAPSASFRLSSDSVLQYVCGKRAEIIAERQRLLTPPDPIIQQQLSAIPPSTTHLFDEDRLAKCNLVFPQKSKLNIQPRKRRMQEVLPHNSTFKPKRNRTQAPLRSAEPNRPHQRQNSRGQPSNRGNPSRRTIHNPRRDRSKPSQRF